MVVREQRNPESSHNKSDLVAIKINSSPELMHSHLANNQNAGDEDIGLHFSSEGDDDEDSYDKEDGCETERDRSAKGKLGPQINQ